MISTEFPKRHIHLGTRLEAAERVRSGRAEACDIARALGVDEAEVRRWVESGEKPVTFDDLFVPPEAQRLTRRARRLVALIAQAERDIRALTARLVEGRRGEPQGAD
jgi:transposase-like protein